MLKNVLIKNFAIVDEISLQFQRGLNVFTGETGAGKSIIIGAIGALLGEKIPQSAIRNGAAKAIIEAEFDIAALPMVKEALAAADLFLDDNQLILRREINNGGRYRAFVNDSPVKLEDMANYAELLLDLHGQHDHQSLLKVKAHLDFLDAYGNLHPIRDEVMRNFRNAEHLRKIYESLCDKQADVQTNEDFLNFQLKEIDAISPESGEETHLLQEEKKLANAHAILEKINTITTNLYESEHSAISSISQSSQLLQELGEIDAHLQEMAKDAESTTILLEEIVRSLQNYASKIELDPTRLEEIRNRLADLSFIKKKYGPSLDDVIAKRKQLAHDLAQIQSLEAEIEQAKNDWLAAVEKYREQAIIISAERQKHAELLGKLIPEILATMGMNHAEFIAKFNKKSDEKSWFKLEKEGYQATASGYDVVEFFIKTNPGQPPRPLVEIASGGEVSRIMLALKSVIAHAVQIPVLLFDEIDTGISGRIAHAVGRKLQELARSHQIICITHLPQIASAGDYHFLVEKHSDNISAATRVRLLNQQERERAIAQLLAGKDITETHIASARELLK